MADFITVPLPADLPTDWQTSDIVAPNGTDAGLEKQYGYNYLMQAVNNAQTAIQETAGAVMTQTLQAAVQVTYNGGAG